MKTRYIYKNWQIQSEKKRFTTYLEEKRFAKGTIKAYTNYAAYFINWLEKERLSPETTTYNNILKFINYCREDNKSTGLINTYDQIWTSL